MTNFPSVLPNELSNTLLEAAYGCTEGIVSHVHASPDGYLHDQNQQE